MGHTHPSTPAQRVQWASHLLAHAGAYGVVTALSRATGVSRPTLYAWRDRAQHALLQTFAPVPVAPLLTPTLEREVLTLWVEAHASSRGIQTCLATLTQRGISLDTITRILQDAEQRALTWFARHALPTVRALALDEIYAAVHRTLTRGRLALLAVWHNHRVFTRDVYTGQSPLHLSGLRDAPSDWLVALGYPPAAAAAVPPLPGPSAPVLALAA